MKPSERIQVVLKMCDDIERPFNLNPPTLTHVIRELALCIAAQAGGATVAESARVGECPACNRGWVHVGEGYNDAPCSLCPEGKKIERAVRHATPQPESSGGGEQSARIRLRPRSEDGERGFQDGMLAACRTLGYQGPACDALFPLTEFLRELKEKLAAAEAKLVELDRDSRELQERLAAALEGCGRREDECERLAARLNDLEEKLAIATNLDPTSDQYQNLLSRLRMEHGEAIERAEEIEEACAELRRIVAIHADEADTLGQRCESLQFELAEAESAREKAEAERDVWNREANEALDSLRTRAENAETDGAHFRAKYYELLMSVGNVYPGETRHETAKRYILSAEKAEAERDGLRAKVEAWEPVVDGHSGPCECGLACRQRIFDLERRVEELKNQLRMAGIRPFTEYPWRRSVEPGELPAAGNEGSDEGEHDDRPRPPR